MMSTCSPCQTAAAPAAMPSCSDMLTSAVHAYNALVSGQEVVEVKFDNTTVKYSPKSMPALLAHIERLHRTCPTGTSAALLGLGGRTRPLSVRFGC